MTNHIHYEGTNKRLEAQRIITEQAMWTATGLFGAVISIVVFITVVAFVSEYSIKQSDTINQEVLNHD